MALMERVATLLRANVNDLIDRAEDPEKMMKQLVVDMENQLLQVKTQVAIAIADQHLLDKKREEHESVAVEWKRKAEMAVARQGDEKRDELARAALERSLSHSSMAEDFGRQLAEQKTEAESLRATYNKLQGKLKETETQCEMLRAQHRRARMVNRATAVQTAAEDSTSARTSPLGRFKARLQNAEAENHAGKVMLEGDSLDEKFATMERDERVERLLDEIKGKQGRMLQAG